MKNMKVLSLLLLLVTAEMHSSYANPDLSFIGAYQMADAFAKNVAPASSSSAYSSAKYLLGGVALTAAAIAAANTVYNYSQGNNLLDTSAAQGLASSSYDKASSNLNDLFTYTANLLGYQTTAQADLIQQAAQVAAQADAAHAQYYEDISNAADNAMNGGTGVALTAEEVHMLAPYAAGILAAGTFGVSEAVALATPGAVAAASAAGVATARGIAGMLANAGTYAQGAFAAGLQAAKSALVGPSAGIAAGSTAIGRGTTLNQAAGAAGAASARANGANRAGAVLGAKAAQTNLATAVGTAAQVGIAGSILAGASSLNSQSSTQPALSTTGGNLYDSANQVESGVVSQWWNSLSPAQKNLGAQAAATIADGDTYDATNQVENGAFSQWYKSFSPAQQQDVQQQAAQSGVGLGDYLNSVAQYALAGANSAYYAGVNALGYQSQQPATQPATAANDQYNYDDLRNQYFN